ncbi:DoxX family protein [Cryobacterium lactosi]|uniref:DoxX family protein n=1 Tax=Cryobacterium lactosi TaxID=1259202 RepID=A0A4R9BZA7_9MICO|nr:DoxX family protein [Cryobacterium lactosi]TFD95271.1 DoxX family protein [Cryobacterium lactosi]
MNIAIWIITGLLALAFIGAGLMKVAQPRAKLAASGMAWTNDYSDAGVKLVGLAELLGGLGLILPAVTGIAPILVPIAAAALTVIMIGAVVWHVRANDTKGALPSLILGILALVVTLTRFGPWAF